MRQYAPTSPEGCEGRYAKGVRPECGRAHYVHAAGPEKVSYYYRSIANRSFLMLPVRYVLWPHEHRAIDNFPQLTRQVRQANADWAAVQDLMVRRRLIAPAEDTWRDVGVEWTSPATEDRALFAYGEFDYPVPHGAEVRGRDRGGSGRGVRPAAHRFLPHVPHRTSPIAPERGD